MYRKYLLRFASTQNYSRYDSAFIGTSLSLRSFQVEFGLDDATPAQFGVISANIVSLYQAGYVLDSLTPGIFTDAYVQVFLWRYLRIPSGVFLWPEMGSIGLCNCLLPGSYSAGCCFVTINLSGFCCNFLIFRHRSSTGLGIIYAGRVIVGLAIGAASNLAVSSLLRQRIQLKVVILAYLRG